jgi:hypothetical protein
MTLLECFWLVLAFLCLIIALSIATGVTIIVSSIMTKIVSAILTKFDLWP